MSDMLPETRAALARYDEWLARTVKSPQQLAVQGRRLGRRTRSAARRLRNMLLGAIAIMLAALLWGAFVAPLGFGGILLAVLAVLAVMLLLARFPRERQPTLEKLPEVPLDALPAKVEAWLEGQRPALPAPAAREMDMVMAQLERLSPQLARLDPASATADDARRLIGDHLPRLVRSYAEVPASHRATPEATGHLRDGLKLVGAEIGRLTDEIARDRLNLLETEGRFLESRYRGDPVKPEGS